MKARLLIVLILLLDVAGSRATTFYIAPSVSGGSNSNDGLAATVGGGHGPFLTFSFALNAARAWCGHQLLLVDGFYGDGISPATGTLDVNGINCAPGNELLISAQNSRRARIHDDGMGKAIHVRNSSYINLTGMYSRSTDNNYKTDDPPSEDGEPFYIEDSHHINVRQSVTSNPNRYGNNHGIVVFQSHDVLIEDHEVYIFHRHCTTNGESYNIYVRRLYCNPRGGKIPGGQGVTASDPIGSAAAISSMYPCRDCILENSIMDGTESNTGYINEQNANFASGIEITGNKVLGNISYRTNYGNTFFPAPRNSPSLSRTPRLGIFRNNVALEFSSPSLFLKCHDCIDYTFEHNSMFSNNTGGGVSFGDTSLGVPGGNTILSLKDNLVHNVSGTGFLVDASYAWSGGKANTNRSFSNGTAFSPTPPSNWGTTYTNDPGFVKCLWVPDGTVGKGQGTGGSDIGATILYRYVDGVLLDGTSGTLKTPLWDPVTGEFPHGEATIDNINRVAGKSLYDIHLRLPINTAGCPFPAGYGSGGTPTPPDPSTRVASTNLTGPHVHVINSGMDSVTVAFDAWDDGNNVGYATGVTDSCGNTYLPLADPDFTSPAFRSIRLFGKINPTAGTCTFTPTTTGTVDGWVMVTIEEDDVSAYGTVQTNRGLSDSPSVTAIVNADELALAFLATSKSPTISPGENEIQTVDQAHGTLSLRLASFSQLGSDSSLFSPSMTSSSYWILQAVALVPGGGGGGPSGALLTATQNLVSYCFGDEPTVEPIAGLTVATAKNKASVAIGVDSCVRIRWEVTGSVEVTPTTTVAPFCRLNGGTYTRVMDTGTNFYFYGPGGATEFPAVPASGIELTQKLNPGSLESSIFTRSQSTVLVIPPLEVGEHFEAEAMLFVNGAVGNTIDCRLQQDDVDGTVLNGGYSPNGVATLELRKSLAGTVQ